MKKAIGLVAILGLSSWAPAATLTISIEPAWSEVSFNVNNFGVHTVDGRFDKYTGKIEFDPQAPEQSKVHVVIDASSVNTQNNSRDKHLRTADFFDVSKYPELTFESQSIEHAAQGYLMTGTLTIKGHALPVKIPFTFSTATANGKTIVHAHGKTDVNRHDFDLNYGNDFSVGKKVAIDLSVSASD